MKPPTWHMYRCTRWIRFCIKYFKHNLMSYYVSPLIDIFDLKVPPRPWWCFPIVDEQWETRSTIVAGFALHLSFWHFEYIPFSCLFIGLIHYLSLQGKEYVFVANSDNLGAVVDLSILARLFYFLYSYLHFCKLFYEMMWKGTVIFIVVCLN